MLTMTDSICKKKVRPSDNILLGLVFLSAFISVAILVGIIGYVAFRGAGSISWQFLTISISWS